MTSPSNDNTRTAAGPGPVSPCPVCDARAAKDYAPFCSKRCADVDLHRWLTGGYAIPAADDDSEGAAGEPSEG